MDTNFINNCTLSHKSDSDNVYAVIWFIVLILFYLFFTYFVKALYDQEPQQLGTLFMTLLVSPGQVVSWAQGFDNIQPHPSSKNLEKTILPKTDKVEMKIKSLLFMFFGVRFPNKLER